MACAICEQRRPRRYCPGVRGDICARCCGEEREETVDCPLDCEHLREARLHERSRREVTEELSPDIRVTEEFLERNAFLVQWYGMSLGEAALAESRTVDGDVREALDAMIRTLRTSATGLIYETRPANPFAAAVQERVTGKLESFRRADHQQTGLTRFGDGDVLGVLVFFQRLAAAYDNGRRRGRAFIDILENDFLAAPDGHGEDPDGDAGEETPRLIVP